jgi:hypothetical protein
MLTGVSGRSQSLIQMCYVKWVPCQQGAARPQVADGGDGLQIWRVAANILNKQSYTVDKGWSSIFGVGRAANNSLKKISLLRNVTKVESRRMRLAGHVARMRERRNPYRILAGKPEGKGPLGRPRRRWEDNIKTGLR